MKFAEDTFFLERLKKYGVSEGLEYIDIAVQEGVHFSVPDEHSRIMPFTRLILESVAPKGELLVMPTEWGIWPSSDNWHLYNTLRKSCGGDGSLKEGPCHCFAPSEQDLALDYIYLFLLFSWGFYIFADRKDDLLFVSHDGVGCYRTLERESFVRAKLQDFEMNGDVQSSPPKLQA